MLFLNSWRVSSHIVRYETNPPAMQKQDQWHSREAQIEPPLFECEWAFRIQAITQVTFRLTTKLQCDCNFSSYRKCLQGGLGKFQIDPSIVAAFRDQTFSGSQSHPYARILKAHSHSMSGGSIWASLQCQCCFWIAGGLVSYLTMWLFTLQLFKNSIDTQEKLRLNLHSLSVSVSVSVSVSELLEYGR
jgi:hypothetical protein